MDTQLDSLRDLLDESERELVGDVETYGFHTVTVGQSENDAAARPEWREVPDWTYTVGLWATFGHPEFVVFGLEPEIARALVWDLVRGIASGRTFEPDRVYRDALPRFDGQPCAFSVVDRGWLRSLFGFGIWFYRGQEFKVLQYRWPDRNGRFAWEHDVLGHVRAAQPDLSSPLAHPEAPPPPA
ncbi:MAG: DUF4262 domain-containing protein [Solirubrobacteraceae bacterium]